jgi:adenylate cyclase
MKVGPRPIAIWALPLAVLAAMLALVAADIGGSATRLRGIQFDSFQYLHPRLYQDSRAKTGLAVRTLDIDAASVARFGRWPWPPGVLARLTDELKAEGAAIIVFAMPLDMTDASSPQRLAAQLPPGPGNDEARAALAHLPSPDDAFAASLKSIRAVTGFTLRDTPGDRAPTIHTQIDVEGPQQPFARTPSFSFAQGALGSVQAASAGTGALNLVPDRDGKVRSVPIVFLLDGKPVPSLDAEAMRLASLRSGITIRADDAGTPFLEPRDRIASVKAGLLEAPLRPDGALTIYFSGDRPERRISAAALDEGHIAAARIKDAIIYIAGTAAMWDTPNGPRNEAEIRAEAMENILLGQSLKPATGLLAELILIAVAGFGMIFLLVRAGALWAGAFTAGVILAIQAFSWFMFTSSGTLLSSANATFALVVVFAAGLSARSMEIVRTRAELRRAFADALAPETLDRIARNPALLKLDGETRNVSYLSCGVRGYAKLAASFAEDPADFTRLMRSVLAPLVEEASRQGGTIDNHSGEGFSAFWNAPLDDAEHAIHACEAANRMTIALAQVNEQLAQERRHDGTAFEPVEIGIAVATGPAIAGSFGEKGRMAYSVTGDCSMLAERIRLLSPQYGPAVIVSDETRKASERGFAFLEVDFIAAGARDEPVKLFAMLGNPLMRASPKFRAMATFHDHIFESLHAQQWEKARELIEQCRKLSGASQKMYDLHLARIAWFEANPPGTDWDGAFRPILK